MHVLHVSGYKIDDSGPLPSFHFTNPSSYLSYRRRISVSRFSFIHAIIKMATTKKLVDPAAVPVMDFKAIHASTGDERKNYLRQLDEAWSDHGAIYVINHSVGTDLVDEAFAWVSKFHSVLTSSIGRL
jgi:hypothetical protein